MFNDGDKIMTMEQLSNEIRYLNGEIRYARMERDDLDARIVQMEESLEELYDRQREMD